MIILGIETSCDETGVAVVEDGRIILANTLSSSSEMQAKYGGVYPEMAAREQVKVILPVLQEALNQYQKPVETVDAIAVTTGPGLIGSLIVGVETAKTLAYILNKPIVPINHVLAHVYANWLQYNCTSLQPATYNLPTRNLPDMPGKSRRAGASRLACVAGGQPVFPALCLIVSGGHSLLMLMKNHRNYQIIGQTRDDASGEAFDKTARLLGLPYPGGPAIEKIARKGNPKAFNFPRGMIGTKNYDFSFSGLKTAVIRELKKLNYSVSSLKPTTYNLQSNLAASIQEAIVDALISKTLRAVEEFKPKSLLLAGGVAANVRLREKLKFQISNLKFKIDLHLPPPSLCTDNAAVTTSYAFYNYQPTPVFDINAQADLDFP
jgi:N6-L-threonylcarbamoyladenine synthase